MIEEEQEQNHSPKKPFDVFYSQLSPELRSNVEIDSQQIATICLRAGVDEDMLAKLKIELVAEPIITPDGRNSGAEYLTQEYVIRLSVTTFVNYIRANLAVLTSMNKAGEYDADLMRDATELMKQQIQKYLDEIIIHELAHFIREAQLKQDVSLSFKAGKAKELVRSIMNLVSQRTSLFSPEGVVYEEAQTDKLATSIISQHHPSKLISLFR